MVVGPFKMNGGGYARPVQREEFQQRFVRIIEPPRTMRMMRIKGVGQPLGEGSSMQPQLPLEGGYMARTAFRMARRAADMQCTVTLTKIRWGAKSHQNLKPST